MRSGYGGFAAGFGVINRCVRAGVFLSLLAASIFSAKTCVAQLILGPSVGLETLTNGGTLLVGDKLFADFFISGDFAADEVDVTPIKDSHGYGIRFSGGFVALGGETRDMILAYSVSVTNPQLLITNVHLRFNGNVIGTGLAEVVEQVFNTNLVFLGQLEVFRTATTNQFEDILYINPPQSKLIISKDVLLTARLVGSASISTIDQTFSQIPEPSVFVLTVFGLVGLWSLRRRKR